MVNKIFLSNISNNHGGNLILNLKIMCKYNFMSMRVITHH
jgi:hypothetical protein